MTEGKFHCLFFFFSFFSSGRGTARNGEKAQIETERGRATSEKGQFKRVKSKTMRILNLQNFGKHQNKPNDDHGI